MFAKPLLVLSLASVLGFPLASQEAAHEAAATPAGHHSAERAPDIAQILPSRTLVHCSITGQPLHQAVRSIDLGVDFSQYADDPKTQRYVRHFQRVIPMLFEPLVWEMEEALGVTCDDLLDLLNAEFSVSFLGMHTKTEVYGDYRWTYSVPDLVVGMQMGEREAYTLHKIMMHLHGHGGAEHDSMAIGDTEIGSFAIPETPMRVYFHFANNAILLATSDATMAEMLENGKNTNGYLAQNSLAASPAYADSASWLKQPNTLAYSFINWAEILNLVAEVSGEPQLAQILELAPFLSLGTSLDIGANGLDSRVYVQVTDSNWVDRIEGWESPSTPAYALIPDGAGFVQNSRFSFTGAYDLVMAMMEQMDPGSARQVKGMVGNVENMFGFNLRDDMLANLGPEMAFYVTFMKGSIIPDVGLMFQVRDREKVNSMLLGSISGASDEISIGRTSAKGQRVNYIDLSEDFDLNAIMGGFTRIPAPQPSWAFVGDYLVIAPWPEVIKNMLNTYEGELPAVTDYRSKPKPQFIPEPEQQPEEATIIRF